MATAADAPQSAEQTPQRPETRNDPQRPSGGSPETHHEAATPDASRADSKTAREKIAALLWWSVPSSTDEEAKERTEQLLDAFAAEVRAAALREGADVVLHSSHGEPMRDAYQAKMQDVGLLRHLAAGCTAQMPTPAETATEYGIRIPGGRIILDGNTRHRAEQVERLARCRGKAMWPDAVLVQRTVAYGEWTEASA